MATSTKGNNNMSMSNLEWKGKQGLVAVVDLDGTLCEFEQWKGPRHFGPPLEGALEALTELRLMGFEVIIWTVRSEVFHIAEWLSLHGFPPLRINCSKHNPPGTSLKPIADVYIDDRSWYDVGRRFSWKRVMERLRRVYGPLGETSCG